MSQKLIPLPSVAFAVEEILGGTVGLAKSLGVAKQTVSTWKAVGHFPPDYMMALAPKIMAAGYEPRPQHFNQKVAA